MVTLKLKTKEKEHMEKAILLLILGITTGLKKQIITIDEGEKLIFSPYVIDLLSDYNLDPNILDLIHQGTELEDILSIIPETLNNKFEEIHVNTLSVLEQKKRFQLTEHLLDV